jgi:hypothetical protein
MIWFNIKELERRLKGNELSDKQAFIYLVANLMVYTLAPYLPRENSTKSWWLIAIEVGIVLIITVLGIKRTFDINQSGDNSDYFRRFISLSFVTNVRFLVFVFLAAIPIGLIAVLIDTNFNIADSVKDLFDIALTAVAGIVYYFLLINSFKRVSQ